MPEALTTEQIEAAEVAIIEAIHSEPKLTVKSAVEKAGISRATFYRLMQHRKGFGDRIRAAQAAARQAACDDLEEFLYERAADPRNPTGCTSAIFLLKGNRPGLYAERPHPLGGGPINVYIDRAQINLAAEATEEMRLLEEPDGGRSSEAVELEAGEASAWAVRQ